MYVLLTSAMVIIYEFGIVVGTLTTLQQLTCIVRTPPPTPPTCII